MINNNYNKLVENYLFATVSKKTSEYTAKNPNKKIIRLGIGDVTLPLCEASITAMHKAVDEMSVKESFYGYGPYEGYSFLRSVIMNYYESHGVDIKLDDIFISDGAKSDLGNILDIFSQTASVLIPDPVYPVYVDTNIMAGRQIYYLDAKEENGFLPAPDKNIIADIIYLCSPNNPTGAAYNRKQLTEWVNYALDIGAVILFDAAYEAFITQPDLPRSIFEIDHAKECAIEFCSLSKTAGFTGTRCGYTVIPQSLVRDHMFLNKMWLRRQATKFNGVPYIIQRGAEAVFTSEGQIQTKAAIDTYKNNASVITDALDKIGIWYTGGINSPYIWFKCPNSMDSWSFFDLLLCEANVVGTPGAGFGKNGQGFFRLTSFGDPSLTLEAAERMIKLLKTH